MFALGSVAVTGDKGPGVCGAVNWVSLWVVPNAHRLDASIGFLTVLVGLGVYGVSRFRGKYMWRLLKGLSGCLSLCDSMCVAVEQSAPLPVSDSKTCNLSQTPEAYG